jgi:hypothetical protein
MSETREGGVSETRVVATYAYRHEAEFARETLRAAGIESVLIADDAGGAYGPLSFTRGLRLLVLAEEADRARALLADQSGEAEPPPTGVA